MKAAEICKILNDIYERTLSPMQKAVNICLSSIDYFPLTLNETRNNMCYIAIEMIERGLY